MTKVALWREVEAGTRHTVKTAMERYPHLTFRSFQDLPSKIATKPKGSSGGAKDVKTYLAADVDALVARLAAPEPEPVDPRWREVETGARYTATTAIERYPQLTEWSMRDLPSVIARKPKTEKQRALNVKTYLAADVDALVARLAAPEPEPVDPRWREVETGARYTVTTAIERYPQLSRKSFEDLPSVIARKPKTGNQHAQDVKTYLAADVDDLVARLAAPEPVDPRWLEVEAGTRYTQTTAKKRYPELYNELFAGLPFEIAKMPKNSDSDSVFSRACDVKTYLASDVDALVARLAAPETVDPRWREVEAGRRYDRRTAKQRYPQLTHHSFDDLPFEIARRPKIPKCPYAIDVKTYAAADIEALAAARAKRARVQEPEPPQEPEPEEEEPEECPVCLDPMTGATATLVCGHLFHKDCITDWASSQTLCPMCRETLQFAP